MASLLRVGRVIIPLLERNAKIKLSNISRSMAYANKDWRPDPYPTTEKARIAAAKKYGLRIEDYKPYPDDGMGHGDYPLLPKVSGDGRDPYEDWDMPEVKRNYGEPIHVDSDAMTEERMSPDVRKKYSYGTMFLWFICVWGSLGLLYVLTLPYPHFQPAMPKQYPKANMKHYTFEPAD